MAMLLRCILYLVFVLVMAPALSLGQLTAQRTIDGSGNSTFDPTFGQTLTQLVRVSPAAYPGDGSGSTIVEFPTRENPRVISNTIAAQTGNIFNSYSMTNFVWQWGQFLDHDIDLTESSPANGTADITVPSGDILGPNPIPFSRSNFDAGTGTPGVAREQINEITAYIDASNVYGSDTTRAAALRTFTGGRLDSRIVGGQELLPLNGGAANTAFAGDIRADEQVGLTAMHTLFVREHNRLASLISAQDPGATDEEIYQTARKIVGAQMQAITYNEFLPALLGNNAPAASDYSYDATLNAQVANEFSTAFYRMGHTMLSSEFALVGDNGATVDTLLLRDAFGQPSFLEGTTGGQANIDLLLRGLATTNAQEIDNKVIDDVRNFLFGPPGAGGMDLASLNIQRGRDHGLPDYNTLRQAYGLAPVDDFSDISSDPATQMLLSDLYGDVNNIDPWVGGLAEEHLPGASVGELISASLLDQFLRLRDGDSFFYAGDPDLMSPELLSIAGDVDQTRLSDIILRNTSISTMQADAFHTPEPQSWAMMMIGATIIAIWFRFRRRAHRSQP